MLDGNIGKIIFDGYYYTHFSDNTSPFTTTFSSNAFITNTNCRPQPNGTMIT